MVLESNLKFCFYLSLGCVSALVISFPLRVSALRSFADALPHPLKSLGKEKRMILKENVGFYNFITEIQVIWKIKTNGFEFHFEILLLFMLGCVSAFPMSFPVVAPASVMGSFAGALTHLKCACTQRRQK